MAGILDSKKRIMDVIVTEAGRSQMAFGDMRFEFVSFTDKHAFYDTSSDNSEVAADAGARIYFEATGLPSDVIIPETNNLGQLEAFRSENVRTIGNTILSQSSNVFSRSFVDADGDGIMDSVILTTGAINIFQIQTGSIAQFSQSQELASASLHHFKQQRIIGSRVEYFDDDVKFSSDIDNIDLLYNQASLFDTSGVREHTISVDVLPALYEDPQMQHHPNFKYMPPIMPVGQSMMPLGIYPKFNSNEMTDANNLLSSLSLLPHQEINFIESSMNGNILGQIYSSKGEAGKLTVIDYGEYERPGDLMPLHIFFAGRLYRDAAGELKFVNIYTLVFE